MAQKKITDLQLISEVTGTLNLVGDNTLQTYRFTVNQLWTYLRSRFFGDSNESSNFAIATSVGSSALTIALKSRAGTDPTSTDLIRLAFRHATLTNGTYVVREVTGALSLVISSGSTLGQVSGQASRIWVYAIDNAGTVELAASHSYYPENELVSTTAEGGAGAADSATAIYSTTARSNVALRLLGYIDNTQATAGTWASAGTQIQLAPFSGKKVPTIQRFTSGSGTYYTPAGVKRIVVRVQGAGGGGAGSGTASWPSPGSGGDSSFGSIVGSGGVAANVPAGGNSIGGLGGAATLGGETNATAIFLVPGSAGTSGTFTSVSSTNLPGGLGGTSGSGGGVGQNSTSGSAGASAANSGAGGSGAGDTGATNTYSGAGGGGGGYVHAIIVNPKASYAYAVGALGAGAAGGTGGQAGGDGGSGLITVEEYYE